MVVSYSLIPLRILGVVGLVLTLFGIVVEGFTLVAMLLPQIEDPDSFEQLAAATAFYRGIQFFAISIVGEYVGRIYLSMNRDPQFIVREKFSARRTAPVLSVLTATDAQKGALDG
jgi:undecaprenyl-phosphate 4-deoxy-4-formamido-L-arabinose transferase